jgi:hypothetical protein
MKETAENQKIVVPVRGRTNRIMWSQLKETPGA